MNAERKAKAKEMVQSGNFGILQAAELYPETPVEDVMAWITEVGFNPDAKNYWHQYALDNFGKEPVNKTRYFYVVASWYGFDNGIQKRGKVTFLWHKEGLLDIQAMHEMAEYHTRRNWKQTGVPDTVVESWIEMSEADYKHNCPK